RQVTNTFLFARDGYRCMYCGRHRSDLRHREFLTRDHVVPMSRGGTNTWENVVTACSPCNNRKVSHLPSEVPMHPLHPPLEPNYVELVCAVPRITTVQAKYIRMFYGAELLRALRPALGEEAACAASERHCARHQNQRGESPERDEQEGRQQHGEGRACGCRVVCLAQPDHRECEHPDSADHATHEGEDRGELRAIGVAEHANRRREAVLR